MNDTTVIASIWVRLKRFFIWAIACCLAVLGGVLHKPPKLKPVGAPVQMSAPRTVIQSNNLHPSLKSRATPRIKSGRVIYPWKDTIDRILEPELSPAELERRNATLPTLQ